MPDTFILNENVFVLGIFYCGGEGGIENCRKAFNFCDILINRKNIKYLVYFYFLVGTVHAWRTFTMRRF